MNLQALDDALVRLAAARSGAVAGVSAVSRSDAVRTVDPARVTDPRWLEIPRPDPAAIPLADIASFRAIVYPPDTERGAGAWGAPTATADRGVESVRNEGAAPLDGSPQGPLPPADRIVDTLRHLRGVHGL